MNLDQYFILLQVTHAVPLAIAAMRYKKLDASFRPFMLLLLLGLINETISYVSIKLFRTNSISFNFFHIVEFLLLLYQFKIWGFFKSKLFYYTAAVVAILVWAVENFLLSSIMLLNPYFRILYAFVIELIIANRLIYVVNEKTTLTKNARFLICIGLIIVYMYQIIFEGALLSPEPVSRTSQLIIRAIGYTDILVQLLYSWAFLVASDKISFNWETKSQVID
jgi:hypothetical protein